MRVLFDTNVLLDVLLKRPAFLQEAALLWDAVARRRIEGVGAAHAVTTVHFIVARAYDNDQATSDVRAILDTFAIAPVGPAELRAGLASGFRDYEDAVTHDAARAAGCDAIVTRNGPDFASAVLTVYNPKDLLAAIRPV